ncbi:PTS sugar transporter subunit IIA [Lentilactobacillus fungorum]|uniref:PTS sugar transporter subunit IIA n=1 Tax=Lentilactobacillus fungorum TaxID=2201250 RepID=A0ABQ3VZH9_9LACO|nr:PTS sugar transporter subunit IIA [Lentilactobacillus fungorum]GHP14143.1 PTS sugar transporter subunit IIA [Lentilactobacillus fungorum]
MLFDRNVILFDEQATDLESALSILADRLYQAGCVTETFKPAILAREAQFPTALKTQTIGVAIPHTDTDKVTVPQIAFMRLKRPVKFLQMGDNTEIQVKLIFMLALKESTDQLALLQSLMALFQNNQMLGYLQTVRDKDTFINIMKTAGIAH